MTTEQITYHDNASKAYIETLGLKMPGAKTIVIYGRPGCGKTRNAEKLAQAYGARHVLDHVNVDNMPAPYLDALCLTNDERIVKKYRNTPGYKIVAYAYAFSRYLREQKEINNPRPASYERSGG